MCGVEPCGAVQSRQRFKEPEETRDCRFGYFRNGDKSSFHDKNSGNFVLRSSSRAAYVFLAEEREKLEITRVDLQAQ